MNVNDLFAKKPRPKQNRAGAVTAQQKAALEEFRATFGPVADKAKQYFEAPCINGKQRYWLLPSEDYDDLPVEKMQYVIKYKQWFLNEVNKVELDAIPYEFPNTPNAPLQHSREQAGSVGAETKV